MSNLGANKKILISIIIGTYNRCESLKNVLDSLLENRDTSGCDYEIIVVDNNSKDKTKDVVESYMDKFDGKLRYLFESNQGLNFARNSGARASSGDIIAYTDDDVIVSQDWIRQIRNFFLNSDYDAVGGRVLPTYPENAPWWIKKYSDILAGAILIHDYGEGTMLYDRSKMYQFVGANMAFKRGIFDECGYFQTNIGVGQGTMGAETEIFNRLTAHDKKIYYCGKILVWHPVEKCRMTLRFIAQWNIRLGKYFVVKKDGKIEDGITCLGGVPRYLIRRVLQNGVLICCNVFNKPKFLKLWNTVFRDIGMIKQYRKGPKQ